MNQPAYVAALEPLAENLRYVARLRLKLLTETLAFIAGFLHPAIVGSLIPLLRVSELCRCPLPLVALQSPAMEREPRPHEVRHGLPHRYSCAVPESARRRNISSAGRPRPRRRLACARWGVRMCADPGWRPAASPSAPTTGPQLPKKPYAAHVSHMQPMKITGTIGCQGSACSIRLRSTFPARADRWPGFYGPKHTVQGLAV